jgi:hypothetical protein
VHKETPQEIGRKKAPRAPLCETFLLEVPTQGTHKKEYTIVSTQMQASVSCGYLYREALIFVLVNGPRIPEVGLMLLAAWYLIRAAFVAGPK